MQSILMGTVLNRLRGKFDLDWFYGKRCMVTGGAGFIGSWLVESLVQLGAEVYVVDNLWRGKQVWKTSYIWALLAVFRNNCRKNQGGYPLLKNKFILRIPNQPMAGPNLWENMSPNCSLNIQI